MSDDQCCRRPTNKTAKCFKTEDGGCVTIAACGPNAGKVNLDQFFNELKTKGALQDAKCECNCCNEEENCKCSCKSVAVGDSAVLIAKFAPKQAGEVCCNCQCTCENKIGENKFVFKITCRCNADSCSSCDCDVKCSKDGSTYTCEIKCSC